MTAKDYFGQLSIAEPIDTEILHQLKMEASEIHFHHPSEHSIDGKRGDLEMQIYHEIPDKTMKQRAFHCSSARAAVSIIFKAGDTESEFLKWQSQELAAKGAVSLNLQDILPGYTSALHDVFGYVGSTTTPPCDIRFCWIILKDFFPATQAQIDFFKQDKSKDNARDIRKTQPH